MVTDISKMVNEDGSAKAKPAAKPAAVGEDGVAKSSNPWVSLTTGCIAGGIECVTVWPMEFIKTQLQLQKRVPGVAPPFNGVLSGLAYTVRTTGFLSLYNGLGVTLVGSIPKAGIRFGANAYCKDLLKDKKTGKLNMGQQFMAGMGAGTVEAIFAVTPMETIKTKLIETNKGLVEGVSMIIKEKGFGGLYQGLTATILKQSSNQGLRFMFFNKYKDSLTENGIKMVPMYALIGGSLWIYLLLPCCLRHHPLLLPCSTLPPHRTSTTLLCDTPSHLHVLLFSECLCLVYLVSLY